MDLKQIFTDFNQNFRNARLFWIIRLSSYFWLFLSVSTMPILTYRAGYNLLSILFISVFGISATLYCVLYRRLYISGFIGCLIVFAIYAFLLTIFTTKNFESCRSILTTTIMAAAIFVFLAAEKSLTIGLVSVIFSSIILCLSIFVDNYQAILDLDFGRIGGEYGDLNTIGLIMAASILCALYLALVSKKMLFKTSLAILSIFFLGFIFLTGSRGALVTGALIFLVYLFLELWGKHKLLLILTLAVLAALMLLVLQLSVFSDLKERLIQLILGIFNGSQSSGDYSVDTRIRMFMEAIEIWSTNPILGYGGSAFSALSNQATWSHSTLADLLCSYGIVGALLWSYPMFHMATSKARDKKIIVLFLLPYVIPSIFHSVIYYDKFTMILYAITYAAFFISFGGEKDRWLSFSISRNRRLIVEQSPKLGFDLYGFAAVSASRGDGY